MADNATAPIFRLVYRSQLTVAPEDRAVEIPSILEASRAKNVDRDITGAAIADWIIVEIVRHGFLQRKSGERASPSSGASCPTRA